MYIKVKVNPLSKKVSILPKGKDSFEVFVKSKPEKNAANKELVKILSDFLEIEEKRMKIIKGSRGKSKIIKILDKF